MRSEALLNVNDFSVIDESENWIVISKPAPLIVHPTDKSGQLTLLGGLEELLAFELINGAKLSIINRLDRETSGIVLVAKNKTWARAFGRAMERRQFQKEYYAIVCGVPEWDRLRVDAPIGSQRDVMESDIWLKQLVHSKGKECITHFEKLRIYGKYTLLRVKPETGRMHQIRVHAAHMGFPLLGDKIYGVDESCYIEHIETGWTEDLESRLVLPRHALHAYQMSVNLAGESLNWQEPLDPNLQEFLDGQIA